MYEKFPQKVFKSKDEEIQYKKLLSEINRNAMANTSLCKCYNCGKDVELINSHSIPAFMLRYIANNGKLFSIDKILKEPVHQEKGVNNAGTFKLLCANCDGQLFKFYENETNYSVTPTNELLAQIVMKNSLKLIYKRLVEIERYIEQLKLACHTPYTPTSELSSFIEIILSQLSQANKDLQEYQSDCMNAKAIIEGKTNHGYDLICYEVLNYKTPIAFQDQLILIIDLENRFAHDVYDPNINLEPLNICVFPLQEKTIVLAFVKKSARRYKEFREQFSKLERIDKLSTINFLIFCYCEDFFIRGNIDPAIFNNSELIDVCATYTYNPSDSDGAKRLFGLNKRKTIPNLLSKDYAIGKTRI